MALLTVVDVEGKSHLVHSSIFDSHRPPRATGSWPDVWDRVENQAVHETAQLVDIPDPRIARGLE